jgi:hypothetical protein
VDGSLSPKIRYQTIEWMNAMLTVADSDENINTTLIDELLTVTGVPTDPHLASPHLLDALRHLLNDLSASPRLLAETLRLLSNVVAFGTRYATLVIEDAELIETLVKMLGSEKWVVVCEIVYVVCNLSCVHEQLLLEIGMPTCLWQTLAPVLRNPASTLTQEMLTLVAETYLGWMIADSSWVSGCAEFDDVWLSVQTRLGETSVIAVDALVEWNERVQESMTC